MGKKYYLAGPMSGIPDFNFPAFKEATQALRAQGYEIISPAEMDENEGAVGMDTANGIPDPVEYWRLLARDIQAIALECDGIIFLPNWHQSRGAKLEAQTGLLCRVKMYYYLGEGEIAVVNPVMIRSMLGVHTHANY